MTTNKRDTLKNMSGPKKGGASVSRAKKFFVGLMTTTLFFIASPSSALASDLSFLLPYLSQSTRSLLSGTTFLTSPTTQNLALLPEYSITVVINDLPQTAITLLPGDTLTSITDPLKLTNIISGIDSSIFPQFQPTVFTSLSNTSLQTVLNLVSGDTLQQLSGLVIPNLSTTNISNLLSGLTDTTLQSFTSQIFSSLPAGSIEGIITNLVNGGNTDILSSLAGSLLTGQTSDSLVSIFNSLSPNILASLPSELTSLISPDLLSSVFNSGLLSTNTLNSLMGSVLSGFSLDGSALSTFMNGLSTNLLQGISPTFFSNILSGSTLSSMISGLTGSTLSALGSNLFSGFTGANAFFGSDGLAASALSGVMGSLGPGILSSLPTSVLGGIAGPIMSMLPTSITSLIPGIGGFGLFVPVIDVRLNPAFAAYSSAFNQYASNMNNIIAAAPDSLRNIIASPNPQGVAADECHRRDANDKVWAYADEPWAWAVASSSGRIPATIPPGGRPGQPGPDFVQIIGTEVPSPSSNVEAYGSDSGSIRCILTALVGYQKISLYVQFQQMLKQHIADAQQRELSNKLLNGVNSANLAWAKQGVRVESDGVVTTEPVYIVNSDDTQTSRNERTVKTIVAQAAAAPGDPIGSLELVDPMGIAANVANNLRAEAGDSRAYFAETVRSTLSTSGVFTGGDPATNLANYMDDPNTPQGPGAIAMLGYSVGNPQDMPLTSLSMVDAEARRRVEQDRARYEREQLGSGFQPTSECRGGESDPYCDPAYSTNVSPSSQNEETVVDAVESGKVQIEDSDIVDDAVAKPARELSYDTNTQGTLSYDPTKLTNVKGPPVNEIIEDLYNSIQYAYFDLDPHQEEWASAALLSIYDTMKFNQSRPQTAIVQNASLENPGAAEYIADY